MGRLVTQQQSWNTEVLGWPWGWKSCVKNIETQDPGDSQATIPALYSLRLHLFYMRININFYFVKNTITILGFLLFSDKVSPDKYQ